MKKTSLFAVILLLAGLSQAQNYFQQEVFYRINVTLDDVAHSLTGTVEFEYHNKSPNSLDTIWVHLWGNAFKHTETEYARQELRNGDSKFYFSSEEEKVYYTGLDCKVDGLKPTWAFDKKHPDIAFLNLY